MWENIHQQMDWNWADLPMKNHQMAVMRADLLALLMLAYLFLFLVGLIPKHCHKSLVFLDDKSSIVIDFLTYGM